MQKKLDSKNFEKVSHIDNAASAKKIFALKYLYFAICFFLIILVMIGFWSNQVDQNIGTKFIAAVKQLMASEYFWLAVGIGLAAQIIDGALGMAYGVTSNSFLLGIGASPAAASGAVHLAEIFTTALSGVSHIKFGNVDKQLLKKIVIPGVFGGVVGVIFLTSIDGNLLKPFITIYLLLMGIVILRKAFKTIREKQSEDLKHVQKLAVSGGFLDAVGGGGWGPIVTSFLIGQGNSPRKTIGTVNTAEFFVALATGTSFLVLGSINHWELVTGLIFGGLFAAPFAAYLTSKLSTKILLLSVGILICGLSLFNLYKTMI
jgi:uncharacterized membrane protein YfcA